MVVPVQCFAEAHVEVSQVVGPGDLPSPVSASLTVRVDEGWTLVLSQQVTEFRGEVGKVVNGDFRFVNVKEFLSIKRQ